MWIYQKRRSEKTVQGKDLLSITDLRSEEIQVLLRDAVDMKQEKGLSLLQNKTLALLFEKPEPHKRLSFELAMQQLGGQSVYLAEAEAGLGQRETLRDTALLLSRYVNVLAACTCSHKTVTELGKYASIPVINAQDDSEHPCQALGDLLTILEKKEGLPGLTVAYIGEGNNVANSLMLACTLMGLNFKMAAPAGYQISEPILDIAREFAAGSRTELLCTYNPREAVADADVVYTTAWRALDPGGPGEERRAVLADFKITRSLLDLAKPNALFMHPLPAHHGEEVDDEVFYGPHSVVFDQAENSLYIQKALLAEMLGGLDVFLRRHK
jgi:ornithine carbamoyltransferase